MMKRSRHLLLPALLLSLLSVCVQAQDQDGGLKQRMSSSEFSAAGLNKLSPTELANLNQWLSQHAKVKTKMVSSSGKPVFYADSAKRQKIRTHIKGAIHRLARQRHVHPRQRPGVAASRHR